MNIFDELRREAEGLVAPGKEDQLIRLICHVIERVGHNVGVNGESELTEVRKNAPWSSEELTQATAKFLIGNNMDETAHGLRMHFE
jgi:hypothetical protein